MEGVFPSSYEEISNIEGIGPYTCLVPLGEYGLWPAWSPLWMVMSWEYWLAYFEVDSDIGVPTNRKIFQAMMEILIDSDRPGDFNQALMDLGSDIESPVNPSTGERSPVGGV